MNPDIPFSIKVEFLIVRLCERILPLPLLRLALWPLIALHAWPKFLMFRKHDWNSAKLPAAFRHKGNSILFTWQKCTTHRYASIPSMFPDRLLQPRWRNRFRCEGLDPLIEACNKGSPAILATLHFSSLSLLRCLLRLRGVPASVMAFGSENMLAVGRMKDRYLARVVPPRRIPPVFRIRDLREAKSFLEAGNTLIMCVDAGVGKQVQGSAASATLTMASGAIRLAQATGASLMPCLLYEKKPWQFVVHVGEPIGLQAPQAPGAEDALVRDFLPIVSKFSKQYDCGPMSFWSPSPAAAGIAP